MGALELERMSWPEITAEMERGRDSVVLAFGATEQHGPHMPLATDALLGDHLALLVAEELDAFLAPTVRFGCSEHHLEFPGTISISEATFHSIVSDVVSSLARGGFGRVILIPAHGGNFGPLAAAIDAIGSDPGIEVRALTDLGALLAIAQLGEREYDVPLGEGGIHAGEWETSMLAAIHPEMIRLDRREPGYTGDPQQAAGAIFSAGVHSIARNGVIGDPARSSVIRSTSSQ